MGIVKLLGGYADDNEARLSHDVDRLYFVHTKRYEMDLEKTLLCCT